MISGSRTVKRPIASRKVVPDVIVIKTLLLDHFDIGGSPSDFTLQVKREHVEENDAVNPWF